MIPHGRKLTPTNIGVHGCKTLFYARSLLSPSIWIHRSVSHRIYLWAKQATSLIPKHWYTLMESLMPHVTVTIRKFYSSLNGAMVKNTHSPSTAGQVLAVSPRVNHLPNCI